MVNQNWALFSLSNPKDSPFDLVAYTDSDYVGSILDRKSITGGCQFLGCRLISRQCKKQTVVVNSTTEAEYVASSSYCGQVFWIQNQLLDYGYVASSRNVLRRSNTTSDPTLCMLVDSSILQLLYCGFNIIAYSPHNNKSKSSTGFVDSYLAFTNLYKSSKSSLSKLLSI
ncbi:hypothetical protein Tco_1318671 [Tanacetum coccineum]